MVIKNASVLDDSFRFRQANVKIEGGRIAAIGDVAGGDTIDGSGLMLIPGLIDVHTHGCAGYDACDGDVRGYRAMAAYYASQGVTSFLFTTMTLPEEKLSGILKTIGAYLPDRGCGAAYAHGVYLEGPFLNPQKKGAQDGRHMVLPDSAMFHRLNAASGGSIRVAALAPELEGAINFIEEVKQVCTLTLAHSAASYTQAVTAFNWGVQCVSHLFNGMPAFHHREPGIVGAALDDAPFVELICDGIHVHPSAVRMVFRAVGADRVVLVSDSMQAAGMPDGRYQLGGQQVTVQDGKATLADGTIAGSAANLLDCVKNAVRFGLPLEHVLRAATINPARLIGVADVTGSIKIGKQADLVLLDQDFKIRHVWIQGKRIDKQ